MSLAASALRVLRPMGGFERSFWPCIRSLHSLRIVSNADESMNVNKKSGVYHTTSVDAAKSNTTTFSVAGQKRTYLDFREKQRHAEATVLVDITNRADFQRPTLHQNNNFGRLEAGEIRNVLDRGQSEYSQRRLR